MLGTGENDADPMYVGAGDYHVQGGSPAIDTGIDLGFAYLGSAPDRGAYEFVPEPGSLLALGTGLIGIGGLCLRRRR